MILVLICSLGLEFSRCFLQSTMQENGWCIVSPSSMTLFCSHVVLAGPLLSACASTFSIAGVAVWPCYPTSSSRSSLYWGGLWYGVSHDLYRRKWCWCSSPLQKSHKLQNFMLLSNIDSFHKFHYCFDHNKTTQNFVKNSKFWLTLPRSTFQAL